jgi:hypothetical protein
MLLLFFQVNFKMLRKGIFFLFFTFFTSILQKKYGPQKILQNHTSAAVPHGGRKACFFCLNSDGGKLYMKIVSFDEIYNFVV